jgi:hypothetical protein
VSWLVAWLSLLAGTPRLANADVPGPKVSQPAAPASVPAPGSPALADQTSVKFRLGGGGVDVVDTATGKVLSTVVVSGGVRTLLIRGHVLYVARRTTGVDVVDVSDPRAPRVVMTVADGHAIGRLSRVSLFKNRIP